MDLIKRLTPTHAGPYRALMLEAYERHLDAFIDGRLSGVAGLAGQAPAGR